MTFENARTQACGAATAYVRAHQTGDLDGKSFDEAACLRITSAAGTCGAEISDLDTTNNSANETAAVRCLVAVDRFLIDASRRPGGLGAAGLNKKIDEFEKFIDKFLTSGRGGYDKDWDKVVGSGRGAAKIRKALLKNLTELAYGLKENCANTADVKDTSKCTAAQIRVKDLITRLDTANKALDSEQQLKDEDVIKALNALREAVGMGNTGRPLDNRLMFYTFFIAKFLASAQQITDADADDTVKGMSLVPENGGNDMSGLLKYGVVKALVSGGAYEVYKPSKWFGVLIGAEWYLNLPFTRSALLVRDADEGYQPKLYDRNAKGVELEEISGGVRVTAGVRVTPYATITGYVGGGGMTRSATNPELRYFTGNIDPYGDGSGFTKARDLEYDGGAANFGVRLLMLIPLRTDYANLTLGVGVDWMRPTHDGTRPIGRNVILDMDDNQVSVDLYTGFTTRF